MPGCYLGTFGEYDLVAKNFRPWACPRGLAASALLPPGSGFRRQRPSSTTALPSGNWTLTGTGAATRYCPGWMSVTVVE